MIINISEIIYFIGYERIFQDFNDSCWSLKYEIIQVMVMSFTYLTVSDVFENSTHSLFLNFGFFEAGNMEATILRHITR